MSTPENWFNPHDSQVTQARFADLERRLLLHSLERTTAETAAQSRIQALEMSLEAALRERDALVQRLRSKSKPGQRSRALAKVPSEQIPGEVVDSSLPGGCGVDDNGTICADSSACADADIPTNCLVPNSSASEVKELAITAVFHDDRWTRYHAAKKFSQHVSERGQLSGILHALLHEERWDLRRNAAQTLGIIGNRGRCVAQEVADAMLHDGRREVRYYCAIALEAMSDNRTSEALSWCACNDASKWVRHQASRALQSMQSSSCSISGGHRGAIAARHTKERILTSESSLEGGPRWWRHPFGKSIASFALLGIVVLLITGFRRRPYTQV